ncbi:hypothetical protein AAG570_004309 [Ranatra chinensis]|uniref:Uncharacterized protein n=1 Tax=Ranatra chinensis TaxID=642074 RepID=A0ABD0Y0J6_9HEMI
MTSPADIYRGGRVPVGTKILQAHWCASHTAIYIREARFSRQWSDRLGQSAWTLEAVWRGLFRVECVRSMYVLSMYGAKASETVSGGDWKSAERDVGPIRAGMKGVSASKQYKHCPPWSPERRVRPAIFPLWQPPLWENPWRLPNKGMNFSRRPQPDYIELAEIGQKDVASRLQTDRGHLSSHLGRIGRGLSTDVINRSVDVIYILHTLQNLLVSYYTFCFYTTPDAFPADQLRDGFKHPPRSAASNSPSSHNGHLLTFYTHSFPLSPIAAILIEHVMAIFSFERLQVTHIPTPGCDSPPVAQRRGRRKSSRQEYEALGELQEERHRTHRHNHNTGRNTNATPPRREGGGGPAMTESDNESRSEGELNGPGWGAERQARPAPHLGPQRWHITHTSCHLQLWHTHYLRSLTVEDDFQEPENKHETTEKGIDNSKSYFHCMSCRTSDTNSRDIQEKRRTLSTAANKVINNDLIDVLEEAAHRRHSLAGDLMRACPDATVSSACVWEDRALISGLEWDSRRNSYSPRKLMRHITADDGDKAKPLRENMPLKDARLILPAQDADIIGLGLYLASTIAVKETLAPRLAGGVSPVVTWHNKSAEKANRIFSTDERVAPLRGVRSWDALYPAINSTGRKEGLDDLGHRDRKGVLVSFGWDIVTHLPCAPDLTSSDFHRFIELKGILWWTTFFNNEEVMGSLEKWLCEMEQSVFNAGIKESVPRLKKCYKVEADYVEK